MVVEARLLAADARGTAPRHGRGALDLAARLPALAVSAREIAAGVMHGVHGRRRAGAGESFWQFRPFVQGEPAAGIDWRRSARDDRTYVREREWEAAQTVMVWMDRSPSMAFVSTLAATPKLDRALVIGLAAADLLVRGGERVGMPGLMPPVARRTVIDRMVEALLHDERRGGGGADLPPALPLPPRSRALLIGDWLAPPETVDHAIGVLASQGAAGHLVQVLDPVEETFPFAGHVEFTDSDGPARLRVGDAASLRPRYLERLALHRDALRASCRARGWTFALHRTDRPASEAVLGVAAAFAGGGFGPAG